MTQLPKIEIGMEDLDYDLLEGQPVGYRHEVMPDGEWIRTCRRSTERDDLFVYRHRETGNFMLSQWVRKQPRPIMVEIMNLGPVAPDRGGWIPLEIVNLECRPAIVKIREMREAMFRRESATRAAKSDGLVQRNAVARHYKRRGQDDIAAMVQSGPFTTDAMGGEALEETRDTLTRLASEKIYSTGQGTR